MSTAALLTRDVRAVHYYLISHSLPSDHFFFNLSHSSFYLSPPTPYLMFYLLYLISPRISPISSPDASYLLPHTLSLSIIADIDGAFFGPTFPNLFFMTYEDVVPEPVTEQVCPVRLFCLSVFSVLIVSLIPIQSLIVVSIGLTLLLAHRTPRAVLSLNSAVVDRLAKRSVT
jgi:Casein kinase II regulatory subunit